MIKEIEAEKLSKTQSITKSCIPGATVVKIRDQLVSTFIEDSGYDHVIIHAGTNDLALLEATNNWHLNIDNGLLNGALFLDLKKDFDTVNHAILLRKLQIYGVDLHSLRWFKSYLSNRKQSTFVNGTQSIYLDILCGVPQGYVLGPLLFLVYINDIEQCELSSKVEMYADDTSLTTSSQDPMTLEFKLNSDLKKIQNWLHSNKLTLNVKKTKCALIGSRYKLNNLNHDFIVSVDNN